MPSSYSFFVKSQQIQLNAYNTDIRLAFLALSSCLGDDFRARLSGIKLDHRRAAFDRGYLRNLSSGGQGPWEQVEMEDMLDDERVVEEEGHDERV